MNLSDLASISEIVGLLRDVPVQTDNNVERQRRIILGEPIELDHRATP